MVGDKSALMVNILHLWYKQWAATKVWTWLSFRIGHKALPVFWNHWYFGTCSSQQETCSFLDWTHQGSSHNGHVIPGLFFSSHEEWSQWYSLRFQRVLERGRDRAACDLTRTTKEELGPLLSWLSFLLKSHNIRRVGHRITGLSSLEKTCCRF